MTYPEARDFLFALEKHGIKPGLDRTKRMLTYLGQPHRKWPSVLVAGTNGKGSVCYLTWLALVQRGIKAALYTSPHLVDFRERMLCGTAPIPEEFVAQWVDRHRDKIVEWELSFFEATTCLAFDWFAAAGCEIAILEVGMGGRWDSTNVVQPTVAALTRVALDHTETLGTTTLSIARTKLGILKPGMTFLTSETDSKILNLAYALTSEFAIPTQRASATSEFSAVRTSPDGLTLECKGGGEIALGLQGTYQADNAALSLAILRVLAKKGWDAVPGGDFQPWNDARWPGRLDRRTVRGESVLFDVAHNADGGATLVHYLTQRGERPTLLLGMLEGKDHNAYLDLLAPLYPRLICVTPLDFRAWPGASLAAFAREKGFEATAADSIEAGIEALLAAPGEKVVTGSFFVVGPVMERLGLSAWAWPISNKEG